MDMMKYFTIGHRDHLIYNPMSEAKLDEIVELCTLPDNARMLDIACGNGEFLCRMAKRWDAAGTGVDFLPAFANLAKDKVRDRGLDQKIEIIEGDGAAYEAPAASFDLASCIGASWIWGGYAGTLKALARWTKPGGIILSGEPYIRGTLPPEYYEAEDLREQTFGTHQGNVETGVGQGLVYLNAIVSSQDDWDRYEGYQSRAIERYAQEQPDDPDVPELLELTRGFRDRYLKWGREGLGWAVYMFMKPGS